MKRHTSHAARGAMTLAGAALCLTVALPLAVSDHARTGRNQLTFGPPSLSEPPNGLRNAPPAGVTGYGQLPVIFEANLGQTHPQVRFVGRAPGMTVFLSDTEVSLLLSRIHEPKRVPGPSAGPRRNLATVQEAAVCIRLLGARAPRRAAGLNKLPSVSNYFIGSDPKKWRTDVPHYARVEYHSVYDGVDLVFYGNRRQIEYDFVVAPWADPTQVRLGWQGADSMSVTNSGDLLLRTPVGDLVQKRPRVFQMIDGRSVEVPARYAVSLGNCVTFDLARYDRSRPLRIDPLVLVYSTYLGGTGRDISAKAIAVDGLGSAYVTGYTASTDFPTVSPFQTYRRALDVFVAKLTPSGSSLVYSTYLGGSADEYGLGIALDAAGSAYVSGYTFSSDFPTRSAFQPKLLGSTLYGQQPADGFVTKLAPAGNALEYSTYLGGGGYEEVRGIAVDASGSAFVTGYTLSSTFPTEAALDNKLDGPADAFVTKFAPGGATLVFSTFLGGSADDRGFAVAVDRDGSAYVAGSTSSTDFPTQSPVQKHQGGMDAFVTKLTPGGNALAYSTYLGGSRDEFGRPFASEDYASAIAVDEAGSAYVTGATSSTDFPTKSAFQPYQGWGDIFVTKLTPAGSELVYSTCLGSKSGSDSGSAIAVDWEGSAYITGVPATTGFPTVQPYQAYRAGFEAFVAKLSPSGSAPVYSTYFGGRESESSSALAIDAAGSVYVTGGTSSPDFPTQSPYQTYQGSEDIFVTKFALSGALRVLQAFDNRPRLSSGTWLQLFGPLLAPTTRGWTERDFAGGTAPVQLEGVRVTVNGKPAFVSYVSPIQVNAFTPDDEAVGTVKVQVTTSQGLCSADMQKTRVSPALLTTPAFRVRGIPYVVALYPDFATYVGPENMISGLRSRPAKPGETIILFAVGCGPTNPATPAGQVPTQARALALPFEIRFGTTVAKADGYMAAQAIGLYQFNVVVPDLPDGDVPIDALVDRVSTGQTLFTSIRR